MADSGHVPKLVSIVVPAFNEEGNLERLHTELAAELGSFDWELIVIDDGSTDATFGVVSELAENDPRVSGIRLSRNFGHQYALLAGLREARGAAVVSMDADLQHPPAMVPELIGHWTRGAKIVHTRRDPGREQSWLKKRTSAAYYRLFSWLSGLPVREGESDFRLLDRTIVDVIVDMNDVRPFFRGLVHSLGYPQATVRYDLQARHSGTSKYGLWRMLRLATSGITSFSTVPLRLGIALGLFIGAAAVAELLYVLWVAWRGDPVSGWASVAGLVAFLFAANFVLLGFLGTYIGHIFDRVQGHPAYLIEQRTRDES